MINGKTVLAIIPARGGSKGIPRKNIKILAGKPLIAWTIEEAKKSNYIDKIIISTDDNEIAKVSSKYGAEVPFIRPALLAKDETATNEVILHAIKWLEKNQNIKLDVLILLQPTSPLRNICQIDSAIERFVSDIYTNCLVSVKEVEENPYWMKIIDDSSYLKNFITKHINYIRRQDLPKMYVLNGAIYIMEVSDFLGYKSFDVDNTIPFIMDTISSIDIDSEIDFKLAEFLLEKGYI